MENFEKDNKNRVQVGSFDKNGLKLDGYVERDSNLGVRDTLGSAGMSIEEEKRIGELFKIEKETRVELDETYGKINADEFIEKVFKLAEIMDEINIIRKNNR